jgi:hypothetical protein
MNSYSLTDEAASRWERPMLIGGVVAGAMFLASMGLFIGLVAPGMPAIDAPAAVKAAFYAEQAVSPIYATTRLLIFAQLAPLALFFASLSAALRRAEGGSGALSTAVLIAGVFSALLAPLAELVEGHLLLGLSAAGADPLIAIGFDGMTPVALGLSGIPQLVVLAGAGLLLGGRLLPRWVTLFGYVVAALGLLATGVVVLQPLFFLGLLSAILFKVWIIAASVALMRRPRAAASVAPRPA